MSVKIPSTGKPCIKCSQREGNPLHSGICNVCYLNDLTEEEMQDEVKNIFNNAQKKAGDKQTERVKKKDPFAIWGFIVGIAGALLSMGLLPMIAIVLSVIGINRTREPGTGRWMAILGIILGALYFFVYLYNFGYLEKLFTANEVGTTPVHQIQFEQIYKNEEVKIPIPEQVAEETLTQPVLSWHYVASFNGVGMKKLPPFNIKGSQWRIKWSCDTTEGQFGFSVSGHSVVGDSARTEIVRTSCPFSGTTKYQSSWEQSGPGDYYLDVLADQRIENQPGWATSWTITVEELR